VVGAHGIAQANKYDKRIAYLVDSGNPYAENVFFAHQELVQVQTPEKYLNLGSLSFDLDDDVTALQAADVICWAVRRRATGFPFAAGFEPIEAILETKGHNQSPFPEDFIRTILADLQALNPEILEEP
jgi:hypothetical protein